MSNSHGTRARKKTTHREKQKEMAKRRKKFSVGQMKCAAACKNYVDRVQHLWDFFAISSRPIQLIDLRISTYQQLNLYIYFIFRWLGKKVLYLHLFRARVLNSAYVSSCISGVALFRTAQNHFSFRFCCSFKIWQQPEWPKHNKNFIFCFSVRCVVQSRMCSP